MTTTLSHYAPVIFSLLLTVLAFHKNGRLVKEAREKLATMRREAEAARRQRNQLLWLEVAPEIEKEAA